MSDPRALSETAQPFPSILQPSQTRKGEGTGSQNQFAVEEYQQLVEYVQFMEFVFDHVSDAILVANTDKQFCYANQAACHELGYTKKELENLRIPDIAPNHDNERYQKHLNELREGKTLSYYTTHRTKQGQELPVAISVYLINFQGQEFTCAIKQLSMDSNGIFVEFFSSILGP